MSERSIGARAATTPARSATEMVQVDPISGLPVNQAVASFGAVTVGTPFAPGIGLVAVCTAAGNAVLAAADGSQIAVPLGVGFNQFGFAVANVVSTTATGTFTVLR